jgi:hypothetical protein
MRNLNIKSDEAYALATEISKRTGRSLSLVVTDALRQSKRRLTKDERKKKWDGILAGNRTLLPESFLSENHDDVIYDDWGLPK